MSLRVGLQIVGLLAVSYLLFTVFLAMGPLAWLILGTMIVIGIGQVHRNRRQRREEHGAAEYCASCGSAIDFDAFETEDEEQQEREVRYCTDCGAPVPSDTSTARADGPRNCPECGAPNEPDRSTCEHCGAEL